MSRWLKADLPFPPLKEKRYSVPHVNEAAEITLRTESVSMYFVEVVASEPAIEMTQIPGGSFLMGSDDRPQEQPIHRVTVPTFFLGTYEVTRGQWRKVSLLQRVHGELGRIYRLSSMPEEFENQLPVDGVRFRDAEEFCERLRRETGRPYRLPTEAEWEYACRAGTSTKYHFGNSISAKVANCDVRQRPLQLAAVGSKNAPNEFGLHEMHGNVLEWTVDRAHDNFKGAPVDGRAWLSGGSPSLRVARGGMYLWRPDEARSSARTFWHTSGAASGLGFRLALSLT